MTPAQITLVQQSFAKVVPIQDAAATLFYSRLFQLDPALQNLFLHDMKAQGDKLMSVLAVAVNGLNDLERLIPVVRDLGARHVRYGVRPEHYWTVGEALLWTLETGLGDDFTTDVKQAWAEVYRLLSSTMVEDTLKEAA